jgi:hypothetical protein
MEWEIYQKEIINKVVKNRKKEFKPETMNYNVKEERPGFVNVYAYVLTDRRYVGSVTDSIKAVLLKEIVCDTYEVEPSVIFTKSRKRELVDARHALAYYLKKTTKYSLASIGKVMSTQFKPRDHATILNCCRVYNNLLDTEDYHRRRSLTIQTEFNRRLSDIDLTSTYISNTEDIVANWENIKHKYLG